MFIKTGDGKILSVVKEDQLTEEEQKEFLANLSEEERQAFLELQKEYIDETK
jgi:hypothetical protein